LHRVQDQYTRLCVVGNGFGDKGAKWRVEKHPCSCEVRKFIAIALISYKAGWKVLVALVKEAFKRRPHVPRNEKLHLNLPKGPKTYVHLAFNNSTIVRMQCKVCFVSSAESLKRRCISVKGKRHVIWIAGPLFLCPLWCPYQCIAS